MAPSVAIAITRHSSAVNMRALLEWFKENARPLPWRISKVTPWESLLAEVILQQTRMETGLPYWERIRAAYPTPADLAKDSEENLLRLWQGCGYYARARNLYKLAHTLDGAELPTTYESLLELPGIGPYTAAAVASMAFGEPVACADGNVRRVISRLRGEHLTDSEILREATTLLDHQQPGDWNQAMMELGSLVCTPRNPSCEQCPVSPECLAFHTGNPEQWPLRRSTKQTHIHATALVVSGEDGILLKARDGRVLGGLWGVPYAEGDADTQTLLRGRTAEKIGKVRHDFTHKRLEITVYSSPPEDDDILLNPDSVPLATLDRKVLALHKGHQGEQS
ncbi:MAG: A/G-specific adenine glycosylase [Candidatus Thalassarchaeum sp.]|nr:A/G-specific adenine glycosylase [Candidatus Thalassarchaeum sp.]